MMAEWHDIGPEGLVDEGEALAVQVAGKPLALFLLDGSYYAMHDLCTHGNAQLSDGWIEDGCVECPLHQGKICIRTGEPMSAPISEAVEIFETRVAGGRIEILV